MSASGAVEGFVRCAHWGSGFRVRGSEWMPAPQACILFNTKNARMRCSFRNTRLRPRKANASAKCLRLQESQKSCSLLRTGTYPCSVSVRLRNILYRDLRETHDRTTARCSSSPWMPARASTKRVRCQEVRC